MRDAFALPCDGFPTWMELYTASQQRRFSARCRRVLIWIATTVSSLEWRDSIKLVKFKDGAYGIRRWRPWGHEYLDLQSEMGFWWGRGSQLFKRCRSSEEEARRRLELLTDIGEPVK